MFWLSRANGRPLYFECCQRIIVCNWAISGLAINGLISSSVNDCSASSFTYWYSSEISRSPKTASNHRPWSMTEPTENKKDMISAVGCDGQTKQKLTSFVRRSSDFFMTNKLLVGWLWLIYRWFWKRINKLTENKQNSHNIYLTL